MIDLWPFCSPDRENLTVPFSRGQYTYATNGHIVVRVPRRADVPENPKAPDIEKIGLEAPTNLRPLPHYTLPTGRKCLRCRGAGRAYDCDKCEGSGWSQCSHCNSEIECKECHGAGQIARPEEGQNLQLADCAECSGSGVVFDMRPVVFLTPEIAIAYRYAALLLTIPGLQVCLEKRKGQSAIPFTFHGGDGWLMPIRGDKPREGIDVVAYETVPA